MTVIDEYLQNVEPGKREQLERIRAIARQAVPDAEETIAYRMPTLKYRGKPFLGFDAHRQHIGVYPYSSEVIAMLQDELRGYTTSSGAIRVPLDRPIPESLLLTIINRRLQAINAQAK
jgi:uncharacterized protein YdhG (YjbR/CyaY superfamily)